MIVVELRRWPGYQNCSKIFKVFDFLGLELKFSFCKRLRLKMAIGLKTNLKKMLIFRFLTIFESEFWYVVGIKITRFAFFWISQRTENIFHTLMMLLAHLESEIWGLEKWKFWKKNFFSNFFQKIKNFKILFFFLYMSFYLYKQWLLLS